MNSLCLFEFVEHRRLFCLILLLMGLVPYFGYLIIFFFLLFIMLPTVVLSPSVLVQ